MYQLEGTLER